MVLQNVMIFSGFTLTSFFKENVTYFESNMERVCDMYLGKNLKCLLRTQVTSHEHTYNKLFENGSSSFVYLACDTLKLVSDYDILDIYTHAFMALSISCKFESYFNIILTFTYIRQNNITIYDLILVKGIDFCPWKHRNILIKLFTIYILDFLKRASKTHREATGIFTFCVINSEELDVCSTAVSLWMGNKRDTFFSFFGTRVTENILSSFSFLCSWPW
jgi:hypothetical protein